PCRRRQLEHRISRTLGSGAASNRASQLSEHRKKSARGQSSAAAFAREYLRACAVRFAIRVEQSPDSTSQEQGNSLSDRTFQRLGAASHGACAVRISSQFHHPPAGQQPSGAIRFCSAAGLGKYSHFQTEFRPSYSRETQETRECRNTDRSEHDASGRYLLRPFWNSCSHNYKFSPLCSPDRCSGPPRVSHSLSRRTLYHKISATTRVVSLRRYES